MVVLLQLLVQIDAGGQQSRQILHGRASRDLQGPFSQTAHHGEGRPAARLHEAGSHLEEEAVAASQRQREKNVQLGRDGSAELKGGRQKPTTSGSHSKQRRVEEGRSQGGFIQHRGQDTLLMCVCASRE